MLHQGRTACPEEVNDLPGGCGPDPSDFLVAARRAFDESISPKLVVSLSFRGFPPRITRKVATDTPASHITSVDAN